ncbi:hypothetical protein ABPG74_006918 [Tetrahymena malaccensis]
MKLNILLQAIKGIDIYGIPVGVNFKNNEIHKTSFGALVSAVIQYSEQYIRKPERMVFDKVQQVIMMGFNTVQSQYIYDPSIIQASATIASVQKVFNETTQQYDTVTQTNPLKIRPCSTNDVKVEKLQIYVEGDYSGDFYSRVDVTFNQCVNSTKVGSVVCQPQKAIDKVLSNTQATNGTPFNYQGVNIQAQATNQQPQAYTAYFENYYIESDVGLIQKDIKRLRDFKFAGTDTTIIYNNPSLVMRFTMRPYKNKQVLMQRRYMKFTDLLAQIGGVLKFLTVIGFILCHPYAKLNLTKEVINSVFDFEENNQESSQQKYVNSDQKDQKMKDQDSCQLESILMKRLSLKDPQNHQQQNKIELNTVSSPNSDRESLKSQRYKRIAQQQNTKFNLKTSQNQIKLFEILPRPILKNSQNKTQSDTKNQFYDAKNQSSEEQVNDVYNSLCKILNKQKKSQRDLQLIQLLDNELYLSLLKLGFLSNSKDNPIENKYNHNDEILENSSAILQSPTLKKYTNYDNLKSDNCEDINFFTNKLEVSDEGVFTYFVDLLKFILCVQKTSTSHHFKQQIVENNMKLAILLQAIKGIDIYGVPVGVNFKNDEIHKTSFGALISAVIFILITLQTYYSGQDLIYKNNPQVITSEQYVRNPERMVFDKVNQIVMMGFSTPSSQYINDPSIIQVSAILSTVQKVLNSTTQQYDTVTQAFPLKVRSCSINDVKVEKVYGFFSKLPLSSLFCFDDNQQIYVEGDYSGDFYSRVDVSFNQCVNSTKAASVVCQPQKAIDKVLSNISFLVYMMDKILDPNNYEQPFDYQGFNIQAQASNQQSQAYTAYFENYYIESDVGLLQKDVKKLKDFKFINTDTTIIYNNPSLVMKFSMRPYKNRQALMQRRYMKFTDLLAQIGGVLKFLTVAGFILCHPYAKLNLTKEVINCVFDFDENQSARKQGKKEANTEMKDKNNDDQESFQLDSVIIKKLAFKEKLSQLNSLNLSQKSQENQLFTSNKFGNQIQQKAKFKKNFQKNNSAKNSSENWFIKKEIGNSDQSQITQSQDQSAQIPNSQQPIQSFQQQKPSQNLVTIENSEENENYIKSDQQEDLFKDRVISRIKKLINPLKQKAQLTMKDYLSHFSNCSQNKTNLMQEGIKKIQNRLDIQNILCQLQEIEKLKKIVLDEDQIKLFEIIPRPVLKNTQNKVQEDTKNQFFDNKEKPEDEKVNDAYNSLCNILKKQKKSQRDLQLIQLLDNNMYLSLQKLGILSNKNEIPLEQKYQHADEIVEKTNLFNQLSLLNRPQQQEETNFLNDKSDTQEEEGVKSDTQEEEGVKSDTQEEVGVKSDFYFKFYKKFNRNSLNLS